MVLTVESVEPIPPSVSFLLSLLKGRIAMVNLFVLVRTKDGRSADLFGLTDIMGLATSLEVAKTMWRMINTCAEFVELSNNDGQSAISVRADNGIIGWIYESTVHMVPVRL